MNIQISQLNNTFSSQVISLIRESDKNFSWSDKQILESMDQDLVLGLLCQGELVAISIFSSFLNIAELLYICVDISSQTKGLGYYLLLQSCTYLSKLNISEIFLEVDVYNYRAIKLYHKLGFQEIALRKKYYKRSDGSQTDALVCLLKM